MAPPDVMAARRAPRRPRSLPFTRSRWSSAPLRPREVATPSESTSTTASNSLRSRRRYGYAPRTSANRPSSLQSWVAAAATICCARMSSGASGMESRSSTPARMALTSAAHSRSSSRVVAKMRPLGVAPIQWPDRPMRWSPTAIERGEPIWHTRSTVPMSMPSSSDAVATTAFNSPFLSRSSAVRRRRRARLPWCGRTVWGPRRWPRWCETRSARRRVLTNTSVVRCFRISSARRS